MNDKLKDLIAQASGRIEAANAEQEAEKKRKVDDEREQDAVRFKGYVVTALGQDVLEAIGPVTFNKNFLRQSMSFEQDSRHFRLEQVTGALVQFQETDAMQASYKMFGNQFNLSSNADSKDIFLRYLGAALKAKSNS